MACEKPGSECQLKAHQQKLVEKMQLELVTWRQNTACEITVQISSHQQVISICMDHKHPNIIF